MFHGSTGRVGPEVQETSAHPVVGPKVWPKVQLWGVPRSVSRGCTCVVSGDVSPCIVPGMIALGSAGRHARPSEVLTNRIPQRGALPRLVVSGVLDRGPCS